MCLLHTQHLHRPLFVLACMIGMTRPVIAQIGAYGDTNSTPIPGLGHDYISDLNEIVDPENGALSVRIAAPAPKERGINLPIYAYLYDSNGQQVLQPGWGYNSTAHEEYVTSVYLGPPSNIGKPNTVTNDSTVINTYLGTGMPANCTVWNNFVYTDPSGGRHPLLGIQGTSNTLALGCQGLGIWPSAKGQTAGDGIYTGMYQGNGANVWVWDRHGNLVAATDGLGGSSVVEDTNGNFQYATGRAYSITPNPSTYPGLLGGPYTNVTIPGLGAAYTFSSSIGTRGSTTSFPFNLTPIAGQDPTCPTSFTGAAGGYSGSATLTLPNQQQYTFSLDPTFGMLNHITYPTGATVDYTWAINSQSQYAHFSLPSSSAQAPCSYIYDWPAVQTRIVSIGGVNTQRQDFSYTTTWSTGTWTQKTTTVTTKDLITPGTPSYKIVYTYTNSGGLGTQTIATYDVTGTLLQTVATVGTGLNGALSPPSGECTTINATGQTSGVFYQYEFNTNLATDKAEYDYGSVSASCQQPTGVAPARETITTYHSFGATPISQGASLMLDRPDSVKVYGNGTLLAETDYTYDEYSAYSLAPVSPAAMAHDDTLYDTSSTIRGNATTITAKCLMPDGTACTDSVAHTVYDVTGQPVKTIDGLTNTTQYSYADNYTTDNGSPSGNTNTYLTKITRPTTNGIAHITTFVYGFNDGKLRASTDENSKTTTFCYWTGGCTGTAFDPWLRPTGVINPDLGGSTTSYIDAGPAPSSTTTTSSSPSIVSKTVLDEMGRTTQSQLTSDPSGTVFVDTVYDGFGHASSTSNPYRKTSDPTYGITSFTYDALGRKLLQCQPDNGSNTPCVANNSYLQWSYSGNVVTSYDERRNAWARTTNALGQLTDVFEPGNLHTTYIYSALGNLLSLTQNGVSGESPRSRSFTYDSLSRLLTTSTSSETGGICYGIRNASGCINGYDANGNLQYKTDAHGVLTTYKYDSLNRLQWKKYTGGTVSSCYQYDVSSVPGASGNLIGRRTNAWTQTGDCATDPTTVSVVLSLRSVLAYDSMGRVLSEQQCTKANCGISTYAPSYTYDLLGNVKTYSIGSTNGAGGFTFTYGYDGANRLNSIGSSNTQYPNPTALFAVPLSSPASTCNTTGSGSQPGYSPAGGLMNATMGSGLQVSKTYDSRLRINCEADIGNSVANPTPGSATITIFGTDQTH